jgi:hypothetical protein
LYELFKDLSEKLRGRQNLLVQDFVAPDFAPSRLCDSTKPRGFRTQV